MSKSSKIKIIEAARSIISEYGIQGATIREIAKQAGVSTGAIYHYYQSKEAILYDVMDEGLSEVKRISKIAGDGEEKLEVIIREIFESMQRRYQKDAESRLQFYLAHEAIIGNEELKLKFQHKYQDWIHRLEGIFVQAYEIKPSPFTQAAAASTIAVIDGMALQILLETDTVHITHINRVLEYMLNEGYPHFFQMLRE